MGKKWSEYSKGASTGLFSYLLSRPLDQIEKAQLEILKNEKKTITRR